MSFGRRFRRAARGALIAAASLGVAPAYGAPSYALDRTRVDLRLSISEDVVHAPGSIVISGRYGGAWGARAGFWARDSRVQPLAPHAFVGADHVWTYSKWRAGLGAVWIDEVNNLNGTHWDFDLSLGYDLTERMFVEFRHHSHARKLGIRKDASNDGWNLVGIGVIF